MASGGAMVRSEGELIPVRRWDDVLPPYRGTPVGDVLGYHNLRRAHRSHLAPEVLVGMCMDHRKALSLPERFAYVLRTGGTNLRRLEFKVSYAVAVGGVRAVCLIAHDQCGMQGLVGRRQQFVEGLVARGGWDAAEAARHFDAHAPEFEVGDASRFVVAESARLRARYPGLLVAPLFYRLDDGRLYQFACEANP